jgi:hypothetical protein
MPGVDRESVLDSLREKLSLWISEIKRRLKMEIEKRSGIYLLMSEYERLISSEKRKASMILIIDDLQKKLIERGDEIVRLQRICDSQSPSSVQLDPPPVTAKSQFNSQQVSPRASVVQHQVDLDSLQKVYAIVDESGKIYQPVYTSKNVARIRRYVSGMPDPSCTHVMEIVIYHRNEK